MASSDNIPPWFFIDPLPDNFLKRFPTYDSFHPTEEEHQQAIIDFIGEVNLILKTNRTPPVLGKGEKRWLKHFKWLRYQFGLGAVSPCLTEGGYCEPISLEECESLYDTYFHLTSGNMTMNSNSDQFVQSFTLPPLVPKVMSVCDLLLQRVSKQLMETQGKEIKVEIPQCIKDSMRSSFRELGITMKNIFINVLFSVDASIPVSVVLNPFAMEILFRILSSCDQRIGGFLYALMSFLSGQFKGGSQSVFFDFVSRISEKKIYHDTNLRVVRSESSTASVMTGSNKRQRGEDGVAGAVTNEKRAFNEFVSSTLQNIFDSPLIGNSIVDLNEFSFTAFNSQEVNALTGFFSTAAADVATTADDNDGNAFVVDAEMGASASSDDVASSEPDDADTSDDEKTKFDHKDNNSNNPGNALANGKRGRDSTAPSTSGVQLPSGVHVHLPDGSNDFHSARNLIIAFYNRNTATRGTSLDPQVALSLQLVPDISRFSKKKLKTFSSSQTTNRQIELDFLKQFVPDNEIFREFWESFQDGGKVTHSSLNVLIKCWAEMITVLTAETKGHIMQMELLDLIFLTGPGSVRKNVSFPDKFESLRLQTNAVVKDSVPADKINFSFNDDSMLDNLVLPVKLGDRQDKASDSEASSSSSLETHLPKPVFSTSSFDTSDSLLAHLSGAFAGCGVAFADNHYSMGTAKRLQWLRKLCGGTASQSSDVSRAILLHTLKQDRLLQRQLADGNSFLEALFDPDQLHHLQVYQAYQRILHRVLLNVAKHCAANDIQLDNGSISSIAAESEAYEIDPVKMLFCEHVNPDLYAYALAHSAGEPDGIGTWALVKLMHNGSTTGHMDVLLRLSDLYRVKFEMGPFLKFATQHLKTLEEIVGIASARQFTHAVPISPLAAMDIILAPVENCIDQYKSDQKWQTNCGHLMSVLTVTRAKISSNAFSTARNMVSFFNEELSKTLYNPDLSSSADETTVLLSQQNKKNAKYSKPEAIAMLKRHFIVEKQNSSFKDKFLQTGDLGEFKNCLLVKTVLKEDGSMRVPMKIPQADLHALPEEVRRAVFAIKQMARTHVTQRQTNGNAKKQPRNDNSANPSLNSSKKQKNSKKNPKGGGSQGGNQTPAADSTSPISPVDINAAVIREVPFLD